MESFDVIEKKEVWDKILSIRSDNRFKSLNIIEQIFHSFYELHGDRLYGDDKAIVCGLAYFHKTPITVIAQHKGFSQEDKIRRQYGMPLPEGYRKSIRLMRQAEKFNRPIICLIDTPGAYPGMNAEERGQAEAIARNLYEMSCLKVPILSIVIGEGGSGGALALGAANKIIMLENAIFSVVSPEGCASILWKDSSLAPRAAEYLKLTAADLYNLGIIETIISEKGSFLDICQRLDIEIQKFLNEILLLTGDQIKEIRNKKMRNINNQLN